MSIVLTILIVILGIFITIFHIRKRKISQLIANIPEVKAQIPFFGITHKLIGAELKDYAKILLNTFDVTKPIQKAWFGTKLAIVSNTPEQFRIIFSSPSCVNKPRLIYDGFFSEFGIIATNGDVQEKHRKILSNSLTSSMLHQLNPIFNEKAKKFVLKMNERIGKSEFNVYDAAAACTLETLMKGQFQHDHDCYGSEVIEAFENAKDIMMRRMTQPWMSIEMIYKISNLRTDAEKVFAPIHSKVEEIIKVNKHQRTASDEKTGTLISQLLNLRNDFVEKEISDEIFIWIFGGYETTAVTLSTCLLMLAMHKNVQQKVIDEIDSANLDENFTLTNEDTHDFSFIEMVLKETMRLFPVAPLILRETSAEVALDCYRIPKDTIIAMPILLVHRNENIWGADAKVFNPERFEAEKMAKMHSHAFVPFSGGKRMCLGYKYAMFFMKIFLVNFFANFEIETSQKYDEIDLQLTPTLSITQGYRMRVSKRVDERASVKRMLKLNNFESENFERKI